MTGGYILANQRLITLCTAGRDRGQVGPGQVGVGDGGRGRGARNADGGSGVGRGEESEKRVGRSTATTPDGSTGSSHDQRHVSTAVFLS